MTALLLGIALVATRPATSQAPPAAPKPAAPAAKPAGPVPAEDMKGLDFTGLTAEQKALAVSILNENGCDCGCGMKLGVCRRDDEKCPRSLPLGKQILELAKQGKTREEIVKTALAPSPTKYVQFALEAGEAPSIGPVGAKVTLLHYFDYQCPFCKRIVPTLEEIAKAYPNDVRIVFKMHPLDIHPNAGPAAEAALAAHAQGKFAEMNQKLFDNMSNLTRDTFIKLAMEIGLDVDKFTKDIDGKVNAAAIQKQSKEVEAIGSTGTPATFVNGRFVNGAKPFSFFKEMIDEELGWATAGNRPQFKTGKNISETQVRAASTGPDPNKVYQIPAGNGPSRGPAGAKVTILHYFDYECPFCVRVAPTLEKIAEDYPKDVRLYYKMHPLSMHKNAMIAAEAALSANAQGKYQPMAELLFQNARSLTRDKLIEYAKTLQLDVERFTKDLDTHAHKAQIDSDTKEARGIGATGTPATFVNGRFISGAASYDAFKKVVDEELAKATK
jgi:protein-disulfide isomerase